MTHPLPEGHPLARQEARAKPDPVAFVAPSAMVVTEQARDIIHRLGPEWLDLFLQKNRKYRKVDNRLGSRGVLPDIYRKTGILLSREWDGDEAVGETTREVAMDLIGHLFLYLHMLDLEDPDSGLPF